MSKLHKISAQTGKRLLVGIAILLLVPMLWMGYGLVTHLWVSQKGFKASAVVVDKSRNDSYRISFEFQAGDSMLRSGSLVNHRFWNDTSIGDSIEILYHPSIEGVAIVDQGDVSVRSIAFNLGLVVLMIGMVLLPLYRLRARV